MVKNPAANAGDAGDVGLVPGLGRAPGVGNGNPLQYSGLENSMDSSPWGCKESDMTERLSFFSITGWGIDLDYCDTEWFALETEIILSFLRLHPSTAFQTLLLTVRLTPFILRNSCLQ